MPMSISLIEKCASADASRHSRRCKSIDRTPNARRHERAAMTGFRQRVQTGQRVLKIKNHAAAIFRACAFAIVIDLIGDTCQHGNIDAEQKMFAVSRK